MRRRLGFQRPFRVSIKTDYVNTASQIQYLYCAALQKDKVKDEDEDKLIDNSFRSKDEENVQRRTRANQSLVSVSTAPYNSLKMSPTNPDQY